MSIKNIKILQWLTASVVLICLSACANLNPSSSNEDIPKNQSLYLLAPASFGKNLALTQLVEFNFVEKKLELLLQIELTDEKIVVVGLTPSGTRLFTIIYDGNEINVDGSNILTEKVRPQYLLADLQLTLWPAAKLNKALIANVPCYQSGNCKMQESTDKKQRTLTVNGKTIITIDYQDIAHFKSNVKFQNHIRNYQLTITTLAVEQL